MTNAVPPSSIDRLYFLYHELRPEGSRYSYVMSPDRFQEQVALFAGMHREAGATLLPEITFDDGHRSDYEIARPILDSYKQRATFFITAGWTERRAGYMNWRELRELHRAGHIIGAHGWSHALLTQCSESQLRSELGDSRKLLQEQLGTAIEAVSLPGGRGNRRVFAACREMGYTQVYTSNPRAEPDPAAPVLGRLNLRGDTRLAWIADLLAPDRKLLRQVIRQDRLKQAGKQMLGDRLYARLWSVINRAETVRETAGADLL